MWEMVGLILMLTVIIYAISKGMIGDLARPYVSMVSRGRAAEIMSRTVASEPSSPSVSQTDTPSIVVAPAVPEPTRDEMLDAFRVMRAHKMSRETARLLCARLHRKLDNNLWAQAAPPAEPEDDDIITPYAGRRTKARYYPDNPELEYAEPTA